MVHSAFVLVMLVTAVRAANDWSTPCLSGVCSYDLPASASSASGTLKIWGSADAISDITPAAGWEILGCNPDTLSQDIRLVCKDDETSAADCAHLYQNSGADGKIVRLPENCGKNAFARVAKSWVPDDQSIPANISSSIVRRDGTQPQVKALTIDTNFAAVDTSKTGNVNFAIRAANVPGANGDLVTSPPAGQQRRYTPRGFSDFIGDAVNNIKGLNDFDVNKNTTLSPFDIDKTFNLVDQKLSCPPLAAGLKVDVDAKAHALASIGVAASGTIVPPKIDDFAIVSTLSADLSGSIDMVADVSATLDSGKILLFEVGVPGLDFPGVLTIGPSFQINAEAKATLDLAVDLNVGVDYHIENAQLVFPPRSGDKTSGTFTVQDTPLKLSLSPSVKATGTLEAHLIPSLNLGISALDNVVNVGVFLELDASATMTLSLEATKGGSAPADNSTAPGAVGSITTPIKPKPVSFGGCFEIGTGLDVNVGADGDFFGLFSASTSLSLFKKDFELFKVRSA
ncbi:hypothetical protein BDQ12DRAFT_614698 [Crucibulum laeve]|uniref:DUF7223 domain-containing protein n=1 Tax=Crucibulum laeve TaxID=68775 RepID=A0A5C3LN58_9AGAR|nr:hypothetical protein BDQ12DRAFT_614698 [Crucibulum laeve]